MALKSVPDFPTPEEWVAWFETELAAAVPEGWKWQRSQRSVRSARPAWYVEPATSEGCLMHDFVIEHALDWDTITVFCGNSDAGAGGVHWYAEQARVIHRDTLALTGLREVLRWIFQNCEPNVRGLT